MINKILTGCIKKYVLIGMLGVLAITSVIVTFETASSGAEVSRLQKEESQLADQKTYLEDSLIKTMSISQLEAGSSDMGYIKPSTLVYVSPSEAVAKLP